MLQVADVTLDFVEASPVRGRTGRRDLFALELRRAPRVVGRNAFLRVVSLEEPLLQLALERQSLLDSHFEPGGDGTLDESHGARRFPRWHEPARVLQGTGAEFARRRVDDRVHKPERFRLVDGKG